MINQDPRSILITGASSGLGEALALHYARSGVTLYILGRNPDRLNAVALACKAKGAKVNALTIDVQDRDAMKAFIDKADQTCSIDLVIANAGISGGTGTKGESSEQAEEIMSINVMGVLYTIHPLIERMKQRHCGQIAIISSLAGFRGLPSAPAYSASKAAVKAYGEALRGALQSFGIGVTVVCPGYIRTPMTDVNRFPMPFIMTATKAATVIGNRLIANPARIAFPFFMFMIMWYLSTLPPKIADAILTKLPTKPSNN